MGKREVYNKLESGGSPTFEQSHSLPVIQFTLLSFSSLAELPEQSDAGRGQSSDMQPHNRSPVFDVATECLSPVVTRRAGPWLGARAASTAEAGVVLVAAELGLQDQVTVGKVGLVHALTAQVHNAIHSSCSQAKGEEAVHTLPELILRFRFPGHVPAFSTLAVLRVLF